MPLYTYECQKCEKESDVLISHSEMNESLFDSIIKVNAPVCCGMRMEYKVSPVHFAFKGKGFHSTDYDKHGRRKTDKPNRRN